MQNAGITWDDTVLDKFVQSPAGLVHGTTMFVSVPGEADRQNVIRYLKTCLRTTRRKASHDSASH